MKSFQGHFLVAAPHQPDPDFADAVILVVEHSDHGAVGVIVTCPRDRHEGISQQRSTKPRSPERPTLYFGDPVTGPFMAVHTDELFAEVEVVPGVFCSGREKNVLALTQAGEHLCKLFTGYAEWEPGQLEHEVEHGIWRAIPATVEKIFSSVDDLWERLTRQAVDSLLQVMCSVKHIPSDASLN